MKYPTSLLLLAGLLTLSACQENVSQPPTEAVSDVQGLIPVRIEPVTTLETARPITSIGPVAAQEEIRLAFKIGGIIRAIYVEEGSTVRKGQLLARLDATEIDAQVRQAQEGLTKTQRDLARVERLFADSVATLEQVQDLTTARSMAEANLEIATFNQQHAAIYAPASGKVLRRFAETGEMIGPGTPVFYLASSQGRQIVRIGLPDVEVVRVQSGDRAEIRFDAWPGEVFTAKISEIAAGADPMTGTFAVELELSQSPRPLKNGFTGKVQLFPSTREIYKQVPMGAVVEAGPGYAAFFLPHPDQKTVQRHEVSRYQIQDDHLLIPAADWGAATQVITRGAKYLREDSRIQVSETGTLSQPSVALTLQK